ncbi:MAG: Ig-like domain-containing protein, partial [Candidatus Gracilibacteria bacterium]
MSVDACNGNPCTPAGNRAQAGDNSFTGPSNVTNDSDGQALNAQNQYKACVFVKTESGAGNSFACSGAVTLTAEQAPAGLSNVTLADNDINTGIDGRDFSVGWTNPNPMTSGYQNFKVYIFQAAMGGLSKDTVATNACAGAPCVAIATLNNPANNSFTGQNNVTNDSNNQALNAQNQYKACVLLTATGGNSFTCSGGVTITAEQQQAPASGGVTGLTLVDSDTTGFGLDGRDFQVSWTPLQTQPQGFTSYRIYIFQADFPVDGTTVMSNACAGQLCNPTGMLMLFTNNTYFLPQYLTGDSANQLWSPDNQYKACVLSDNSNSSNRKFDCSSNVSVTSDNVSDNMAPSVEHMSPTKGIASANNYFYAKVFDEQTQAGEFGNAVDGQPEYIKLYYGQDLAVAQSEVIATPVEGDLFQFVVPGAAVPAAGGNYKYYIEAKDRAGNSKFICANSFANDATACKASPFVVITAAAGPRSISGRTLIGVDQGLAETRVFITSWAIQSVTSDGSGNFSITNLPGGNGYELSAYKVGKCSIESYVFVDNQNNASNANLTLMSGCQNENGARTKITYSMPSNAMTGVDPSTNKIVAIASNPLDPSKVNNANAAAGSPLIFLTTDGNNKIAGSVVYCQSSSTPGCESYIGAADFNAIVFIPAASLTPQTSYSLIIGEGVTDAMGQPIEGNRLPAGHQINFFVGGAMMNQETMQQNFGSGGAYMPPYVSSTMPLSGMSISSNGKVTVEFNTTMNTGTLTSSNIKLKNSSNNNVSITVTPDLVGQKMATITPAALPAGEYRLQVMAGVKNTSGVCMMSSCSSDTSAFEMSFNVKSTSDSTAPTLTPMLQANTSIPVNLGAGPLEFGANEALDPGTVSSTNITMSRGSSDVPVSVRYFPDDFSIQVMPIQTLMPNSQYSVNFSSQIKDMAGNSLSDLNVVYLTGGADKTAPGIKSAECDDYRCEIQFIEPVSSDAAGGSRSANSVLNHSNVTLTMNGGSDLVAPNGQGVTPMMSYEAMNNALIIEGLAMSAGAAFSVQFSNITDLAGNMISAQGNSSAGVVQDSKTTFGNFGMGGDMGGMMYAPPTIGEGGMMETTQSQGFGAGGFTAEQFAFGGADMAYPFNATAGKDSNVFQVRFTPNVALQNGDIIQITFPRGTDVSGVRPDTYSSFYRDMNESFGAGVVGLDTSFDSDGISVDAALRIVTLKFSVTNGTPGATDRYVIDLRGIINPILAKGPDTSGYTVGIKGKRGETQLFDKTSMPYYIQAGGQNTITVNIFAGSQQSPVNGATGDIYFMAGGPAGSMEKNVTLTNGIVTQVDGIATSNVNFTGLVDGCYFVATDSMVTLGSVDYYGQDRPESICVDANNRTKTKNIVLRSSDDDVNTVPLTVKITGMDFNGKSVEIFAGGPGTFVKKQIDDLTTPDADGYTLRLNSNGQWFVGIQPTMAKGKNTGIPDQLPGVPPSPMQLNVNGLGTGTTTISSVMGMNPPGTSFNASTNTLTFTFATADKAVTGQVTDGTTPLSNVQVFIHNQGFGMPSFGRTDGTGNFSINLTDYGSYEIGAFMDGLPPSNSTIEVRPDGSDQGSSPDIFYKGKQITNQNPLVIKLNKPNFSISGKVLDANGNGIGYAPVSAKDANGTFVSGGTDASGNYTLFVAAGTWNIRSELPPDKTDACGTFTKEVVISDASKTNQNIEPTAGTCVTLSGTVTASGTALANVPLSVEAWDTVNNRPEMGGGSRFSSTDSSGNFNVKVAANKTYRIGTWSPNAGEISATQVVVESDISNIAITNGTTGEITFSFTGGTSSMEAFVELKKSNDVFTRMSKNQKGLESSFSLTMKQGSYTYFVNVIGVGEYSGPVSTGGTVTIDLSAKQLMTLSGNVKDTQENILPGVLVSLKDSTGFMQNAVTNASGNYSINVKAGNYAVSVSMAGYVAGESPKTVALTQSIVNYDFGGASPDQSAMIKALYTIEGTIYQSNGSTPANGGFVTAVETTTGLTVTGPIDAQDGGYSIPVNNGTWTLKAVAPLHAKTTLGTNVTVNGGNQTGKNITLTADATKESTSTSKSLAANTGGSFNDTGNTDMKVTVGAGVLETGSGNVTLNMEKSFTAPDTASFEPLADATFTIEATGSSAIKTLNGNAEITIDFSDLVDNLPEGYNESDLKLAYFSNERNEYIPVEGG